METEEKMSEIIQSVDRALEVVHLLYEENRQIGISEIARKLVLHKSTVHRLLATLENREFVYQNKENGKYGLGIKLYAIGIQVGESLSMLDIIKPYSKELFDEFKEVVNVSILDKDSKDGYKTIVILKEVDMKKVLSVNPNLGSRTDAHASSVGKSLLAFYRNLADEKITSNLAKKYTKNTLNNKEDFAKEMIKIKEQGYAIDNEEQEMGLYCIGAPIFNGEGDAVAAISISGPTTRMKSDDVNYKVDKVVEIANKITEAIKHLK